MLLTDSHFELGIILFQGSTGVKFCDVAGIDEAVEELQEVILLYISDFNYECANKFLVCWGHIKL